jgi:DNA-binding NarL/FixJ family response regulator
MDAVRVLIVADFALQGESLARLLTSSGTPAVWCGDVSQALRWLQDENWSAVVLDPPARGNRGIELLTRIKRLHPRLPVLLLGSAAGQQIAQRVLRSGAAGYLTKDCGADALLHAVQRLLRGERDLAPRRCWPLSGVEHTGDDVGDVTQQPHLRLSAREMQVFLLLAQGKPVPQVAAELRISCKTVCTHKVRLMRKLALDDDAELVRYATEHGLVR